jgi:hypothetical protein
LLEHTVAEIEDVAGPAASLAKDVLRAAASRAAGSGKSARFPAAKLITEVPGVRAAMVGG